MTDRTPDNVSSTPKTRGSAMPPLRASGLAPQRLNMATGGANSPASTISSITTSGATTASARRARSAAVARTNDLPLSELVNVPSPDLVRGPPNFVEFDPIQTENEYDQYAYNKNPGAIDSEDEPDYEDEEIETDPLKVVHQNNRVNLAWYKASCNNCTIKH